MAHCVLELMNAFHRYTEGQTHSVMTSLNTTQWRTLLLIRYNPDQTQQILARHVGITPASMTSIVDLLEHRGWVRRHPSPTNRSAYGLRMTPAGMRTYRRIERELTATERLCARIMGPGGLAKLAPLMIKLRDGLNQACALQAQKRTPRSRPLPSPE